jgi:hypothetical protein
MRHVEHDGHQIPTLTIGDLIELEEVAYQAERKRVIENIEAFGIEGPDRRMAMQELEDRRGTNGRWIFTAEGMAEVIRRCCSKVSIDPDALDLDPVALSRLVARLAHFDLEDADEDVSRETDEDEEEVTGRRPLSAATTGGPSP